MSRRKIAFVVQRYGPDIAGGSESLARELAERLASDYRVSVMTTCARDYVTWRNELPEGVETLNGVEVHRHAVEEQRDLQAFNRFSEDLYRGPHSEEDERLWLRRQGPYVPRLIRELDARQADFDAIVFFTYLYYPTYWGLKLAPERSVLVPTAHDEPPLRFRIYDELFGLPRAIAFLTEPEAELVRARFRLRAQHQVVAGIGVDPLPAPDVEGFRIRHEVRSGYALYAGRIDAGKGCAEMLDFFERYRRDCRGAAELLMIGKLAMPSPRLAGVRYLGYLSEPDKQSAMAGARALICPSPFESLSIVLLEGLAHGTPALVTRRSQVLTDHVLRAQAGLYYEDAAQFVECLDLLVREPGLRRALGENGRRYVAANFRWDAVLRRYREAIEAVAHGSDPAPKPDAGLSGST